MDGTKDLDTGCKSLRNEKLCDLIGIGPCVRVCRYLMKSDMKYRYGPKLKGTVDVVSVAWVLNDQHSDASVC